MPTRAEVDQLFDDLKAWDAESGGRIMKKIVSSVTSQGSVEESKVRSAFYDKMSKDERLYSNVRSSVASRNEEELEELIAVGILTGAVILAAVGVYEVFKWIFSDKKKKG